MPATKETQRVMLDDLAARRLSERVLTAISETLVEQTVDQLQQWEASEWGVRVFVTKGKLVADIRLRISARKAFAIVTGLLGSVGAVIALIVPHLPKILTYWGIN